MRTNKIRFTKDSLDQFVKDLRCFKALRILTLQNNPFEDETPEMVQRIVNNLPQSVEMYNN